MPADVYIYRDTGDSPESAASAAPGHGPDERDASYWYDLPATGTSTGTSTGSLGTGSSSADPAPVPAETRGPFEPLVPSHGPAPVTPALVPEPAPVPDTSASQVPPNAAHHPAPPTRTGKLDQIREFYLTAEAIGEENVDKHFDHLLAQQRELISKYFKQSPAAPAGPDRDDAPAPNHPGAPDARSAPDPRSTPDPRSGLDARGGPDARGGQSEDAHGVSVTAEQPRVW